MDKQKLDYFRRLLLSQREQAIEDVRADRAAAVEGSDGVTDSGEESELDSTRSTALNLASRQSQLIEEIDDALRRIDDGTYGLCAVCGKPIDEERLNAMPSARYDAACEATLERSRGVAEMPTL